MIHTVTIGEDKFYADVDKTKAEMPFLLMHALDDIGVDISLLARSLAPQGETGVLRSLGIGFEQAKPTIGFAEGFSQDYESGVENLVPEGDKTYRATVGLRREVRYALFVHEGTGLWGPKHSRIYPSRGNVFRIEKEGRVFYRRWISGQRPQPFLRDAYEVASLSYVPVRVKFLGEQIVHTGVG